MFGYFALNAWITSSLGGSSLGSPQNDQVSVAFWLFALWAGAAVAAGAPVCAAGALDVVLPWHAVRSEAETAPRPATVPKRRSARREIRDDGPALSIWGRVLLGCRPD